MMLAIKFLAINYLNSVGYTVNSHIKKRQARDGERFLAPLEQLRKTTRIYCMYKYKRIRL